jgi:hypothetical protein
MERMTELATVVMILAAMATAGGCAQAGRIEAADAVLPAGEGSAGFLDRMSSQEHATENDAFRAMLYLLDGKDELESFRQRVESLSQRGVVSSGWDFGADRPLTRGKLAYMVYQVCKVPGGLTLTLFGPSQRYCLRELQYRGMMGRGSMFGSVSGMELVAVLTRADAYLQTGQVPRVLAGQGG